MEAVALLALAMLVAADQMVAAETEGCSVAVLGAVEPVGGV